MVGDIVNELDSREIESSNLPGDMVRSSNEEILKILALENTEFAIGYKFEDYQMAYKYLYKMFIHGNIGLIEKLMGKIIGRK